MSAVTQPSTEDRVREWIRVAEHNRRYAPGSTSILIVLDGLEADRYYGVNVEVFPAAPAVGGWVGQVRDGVGNTCTEYHPTSRVQAIVLAYDAYLDHMIECRKDRARQLSSSRV